MRRIQARARELVALRAESERLAQEQSLLRGKVAQVNAALTTLWQREQVVGSSVNLQERRAQVEADRARLLHRRARLLATDEVKRLNLLHCQLIEREST